MEHLIDATFEHTGIGKAYTRYDFTPVEAFKGRLLELGAGLGANQLLSKHKELFLEADREGRYLGLEISDYDDTPALLTIQKGDILEADFQPESWDTIMMADVIEHIPLRDWPPLFEKLKRWLRPHGYVVLSCPYREPIMSFTAFYVHSYHNWHVVFDISKPLIWHFLPNARITTKSYFQWRAKGENHLWAFGRLIKRLLTRHPYGVLSIRDDRLEAVWQKEG